MTGIAIAAASGAGAVIAVVGAMLYAFVLIRDAEKRAANARVSEQEKIGLLAIAMTNVATEKARADYQQERADGLDHELEIVAASGDPASARARVLSRLTRATNKPNPADGGSTAAVPDSKPGASVASPLGDGLLRPGE